MYGCSNIHSNNIFIYKRKSAYAAWQTMLLTKHKFLLPKINSVELLYGKLLKSTLKIQCFLCSQSVDLQYLQISIFVACLVQSNVFLMCLHLI